MNDCHEWTGARTRSGYGVTTYMGRTTGAHRAAWEMSRGPIPEGMTIDHLCANRACVNVDHLDVCTQSENTRRAWRRYRQANPVALDAPPITGKLAGSLLTAAEVANRLQVSVKTVARLANAGVLPTKFKAPGLRGARLFAEDDVARLERDRGAAS